MAITPAIAAKKARIHSGTVMIHGDSWGSDTAPSAWWAWAGSGSGVSPWEPAHRSEPKKARPVRRLM